MRESIERKIERETHSGKIRRTRGVSCYWCQGRVSHCNSALWQVNRSIPGDCAGYSLNRSAVFLSFPGYI